MPTDEIAVCMATFLSEREGFDKTDTAYMNSGNTQANAA
jgi:hypothetical protein